MTKKMFHCAGCHQDKEGSPTGGLNTPEGEKVVCSGECWVKAMAEYKSGVSAEAMARKIGN
jgi:hypothetical protein